jgi:hypothetical protein
MRLASAWRFSCAACLAVAVVLASPPSAWAEVSGRGADRDSVLVTCDSTNALTLEDVLEQSLGIDFDSELLARCLWLVDHPIDINDASQDDLLGIPGLTTSDVEAIQRHRRSHRPFREVMEVANIEGLSARAWGLMRSFVTVGTHRLPLVDNRSRLSQPLQTSSAADTAYLGSTLAATQRLVVSPARGWECGAVGDADAGERLQDGFVSAYFQHESSGFFRRLIVGDMVATAGLGLIWGQGVWRDSPFKGSFSGSLSPHRSSGELNYLRGIGMSVAFPLGPGELRAHVTASTTPCAASLDSSDEITSLSSGGAYRTPNSVRRKNAVHLRCIGGRVEFIGPSAMRCGASFAIGSFDHPIKADRLYEPSGSDFNAFGVDLAGNIGPIQGDAEFAASPQGVGAIVLLGFPFAHGCVTHFYIRNCAPGFHSPLTTGGALGEATRNSQELHWNLEVTPFKKMFLQVEIVHFRKPWRSASEVFPGSRSEFSIDAGMKVAPGCELAFRGEKRTIEQEGSLVVDGKTTVSIQESVRRRIRCICNLTRGERWHIRGGIEAVRFMTPAVGTDESGWLASGEIRWTPGRLLSLAARATFFQIESYDARIYAIESDVGGGASSTMLTGTGRKWSCQVVSRPLRNFRLALQYVSTTKMKGSHLAGSDSQIAGEIDFQLNPR